MEKVISISILQPRVAAKCFTGHKDRQHKQTADFVCKV